MITNPNPTVYSYIRFSTPDQIKGDSNRRQIDLARDWCNRKDFNLDESLTIQDEGKSAFKGAHLDKDSGLGAFLQLCDDGVIERGSILIVEAVDRLTRMGGANAWELILGLLRHVDLVILSLGNEIITRNQLSMETQIKFMFAMELAHKESQQKQGRLKEAWMNKRQEALKGAFISKQVPAWIEVTSYNKQCKINPKIQLVKKRHHKEKTEDIIVTLNPEKAKIIKDIYKRFDNCDSLNEITRWLNQSGETPWGGGRQWYKSYIQKILSNPSCCGDFQLYQIEQKRDREGIITSKRIPVDLVKDYYPKVVTRALWNRVQAIRQPSGMSGARPEKNPLATLCKCSKCGSTLTRSHKGKKGGKARLICTNQNTGGGCDFQRVILDDVVSSVKNYFDSWNWSNGLESLLTEDESDRNKLIEIDKALAKTAKQPFSTALTDHIIKLSEERRKLELKYKGIKMSPKRFNESIAIFRASNIPKEQNVSIRQVIEKVTVHKVNDLEIVFRGTGTTYRFRNLDKPFFSRKGLTIGNKK